MTDQNGMFWAISLATCDADFLQKWHEQLRWEALPKGPMRFILAAALTQWEEGNAVLDGPSLQALLPAEKDEETQEEIRDTYQDLIDAFPITENNEALAWERAEEWIQNFHLGQALDRARQALVVGDRGKAFATLLDLHEVSGVVDRPPMVLEEGAIGEMLRNRPPRELAVPTGLEELDNWWEGGLYPGNFGVVLAATNVGKSFTLCFLAAEAFKANKRVLFFTYELTKGQIAERILTSLFQCAKQDLDPDTVDRQFMALRAGLGLDRGSIQIDDGIETISDLRRRLEQEQVDLVLLDSADDIQPVGKHEKTYDSQGEIYSKILLTICQQLEIPVWTSTQATRDAVDKARINLKHMGDSFIKARRAHLVLGLSQSEDERDNPTGPLVKAIVLKDTLHGSRGKMMRYMTYFGRGDRGWPQYSLYDLREEYA